MCHQSADGVLRDICDGEFFSQHPVFSQHNDALQIILYYDNIDMANLLGSRAGNHKLGMTTLTQQSMYEHVGCFYFTLGNICPMHRSTLLSIFVLAIAKSSLLREYTADAILERFVEESNMLSQVKIYTDVTC